MKKNTLERVYTLWLWGQKGKSEVRHVTFKRVEPSVAHLIARGRSGGQT